MKKNLAKEKNKMIPISLGDGVFGFPFDMNDNAIDSLIRTTISKIPTQNRPNEEYVEKTIKKFQSLKRQDNKYSLVNQMVSSIDDMSQILVNKASNETDEDNKTILHILAKCSSAIGAAQLLFNFSYYIEFITILRMIFEQCGYVCQWTNQNKQPKKGPQSIQISLFKSIVPSVSSKVYDELCETAHLYIYKNKKCQTVNNEYSDKDALIISSEQKTMDNFHIFEDVYKILVESINYVITEKYPSDQDLNDYLLSLLITKECIIMLSHDGRVNFDEINKKFPDALNKALRGFDLKTQQCYIDKYGSLDAAADALKEKMSNTD